MKLPELPPLPRQYQGIGRIESTGYTADQMRAYAQEAARQEREACAKAAEDVDEPGWTGYECPNTFNDGKWKAAEAIRSRSNDHV